MDRSSRAHTSARDAAHGSGSGNGSDAAVDAMTDCNRCEWTRSRSRSSSSSSSKWCAMSEKVKSDQARSAVRYEPAATARSGNPDRCAYAALAERALRIAPDNRRASLNTVPPCFTPFMHSHGAAFIHCSLRACSSVGSFWPAHVHPNQRSILAHAVAAAANCADNGPPIWVTITIEITQRTKTNGWADEWMVGWMDRWTDG